MGRFVVGFGRFLRICTPDAGIDEPTYTRSGHGGAYTQKPVYTRGVRVHTPCVYTPTARVNRHRPARIHTRVHNCHIHICKVRIRTHRSRKRTHHRVQAHMRKRGVGCVNAPIRVYAPDRLRIRGDATNVMVWRVPSLHLLFIYFTSTCVNVNKLATAERETTRLEGEKRRTQRLSTCRGSAMGSALPPRRVPAVSALVREGAARARAQAKTRRSLSLHSALRGAIRSAYSHLMRHDTSHNSQRPSAGSVTTMDDP